MLRSEHQHQHFSLSIFLDLKTEMLSQVRKRPNVEWWNSPVKPATLAVDGEGVEVEVNQAQRHKHVDNC